MEQTSSPPSPTKKHPKSSPQTDEQLIDELKQILQNFEVRSIDNVNHNPHPYCITPRHLEYADKYLDEKAIKKAEKNGVKCGMYHEPGNPQNCVNHRSRSQPGFAENQALA